VPAQELGRLAPGIELGVSDPAEEAAQPHPLEPFAGLEIRVQFHGKVAAARPLVQRQDGGGVGLQPEPVAGGEGGDLLPGCGYQHLILPEDEISSLAAHCQRSEWTRSGR